MHHSLQIMFILPLMTGHLFWKAIILGGLGVPLYVRIDPITDFCIYIIPGAVFQARPFKFGTVEALNKLIN